MNLQRALNFKTPWKDKNLITIIECETAEFWKQPDISFIYNFSYVYNFNLFLSRT